jgi:hypothetical protein
MDTVERYFQIDEDLLCILCEKDPSREADLRFWVAVRHAHIAELSLADIKRLKQLEQDIRTNVAC